MAISHKQEGICKGEAEGVHTGSVLSLSSAGLQPSVTNYHIQRLFSRLAPLPTKCYTGKNNPARKKKKNPTGYVIHPLLFAFRGCFLAFTI